MTARQADNTTLTKASPLALPSSQIPAMALALLAYHPLVSPPHPPLPLLHSPLLPSPRRRLLTITAASTPSPTTHSKNPAKNSKNPKNSKNRLPSHPAFGGGARPRVRTPVPPTPGEPFETATGVRVTDAGVTYRLAGAPFEFQYSYTEAPRARPLALREPPFLPFGPDSAPRPWTGRKPFPKSKKQLPEFDSFRLPPHGKKGVKPVQAPGPFLGGTAPQYRAASREEVLGAPLTAEETAELVSGSLRTRRLLSIGRDGLTHNMMENIHALWKRKRVCKIKCKGVCTVDLDNVCRQLEEKVGGKVIHRDGGVIMLFRGRNYNYRTRPKFPLMLWKPAAPVYPRLVKPVPEGLMEEEVKELRARGRQLLPICKLSKNGVYTNLVSQVREAFEACEIARVNCAGLNKSDCRKIGAKLQDLVPCVLLSFEFEHILMWRGREWKSSLPVLEEDVIPAANVGTEMPLQSGSPGEGTEKLNDPSKPDVAGDVSASPAAPVTVSSSQMECSSQVVNTEVTLESGGGDDGTEKLNGPLKADFADDVLGSPSGPVTISSSQLECSSQLVSTEMSLKSSSVDDGTEKLNGPLKPDFAEASPAAPVTRSSSQIECPSQVVSTEMPLKSSSLDDGTGKPNDPSKPDVVDDSSASPAAPVTRSSSQMECSSQEFSTEMPFHSSSLDDGTGKLNDPVKPDIADDTSRSPAASVTRSSSQMECSSQEFSTEMALHSSSLDDGIGKLNDHLKPDIADHTSRSPAAPVTASSGPDGMIGNEPSQMELSALDVEKDLDNASPKVSCQSSSSYRSVDTELNLDCLSSETSNVIDEPAPTERTGTDHTVTPSVSSYMEGVVLLLKQAVDSGTALDLDGDDFLDADLIYQKSVAFSKTAPQGLVFRHKPKPTKAPVRRNEGKKHVKLDAQHTHSKLSTPVEKKPSTNRGSRTQKRDHAQELFSDVVPQGTLGVDELAKLLG